MNDLILVLDAGTGGCRAITISASGAMRGRAYRQWDYFEPPGLEVVGREFDPCRFRDLLSDCARDALTSSPGRVAAVVVTGQRHGCIFLDADDQPLYGGPNRDARGINYTDEVAARLGEDRVWSITGHWPPWIFLPARLEWFRREQPDTFARIRRILMIPDWVGWMLTGVAATEPSTASDTMLLDLAARDFSAELIDATGIDRGLLPAMSACGARLGEVSRDAAREFGVPARTPVFTGAADTPAAMIAAGAAVGDAVIVAGSTGPVMRIVDAPLIDPDRRLVSGCHPEPGRWLVESNAGDTGGAWRNYVEGHLGLMARDYDAVYPRVEALAAAAGVGAAGARAFMGPIIYDMNQMSMNGRAGIVTTFPPGPENAGPGAFARAILENIAFALRANLEQAEAVAGPAARVFLAGGMTRSRLFCAIVGNVLGREILAPVEPEATALGCALTGFVALGTHPSLEVARQAMMRYPLTLAPDHDSASDYNFRYDEWREEYVRMMEG